MMMPRVLAVVLLVVIPASAAVAYYALGRYTAMDPAFIEMMERQSANSRGHSQRDMQKMLDDLKARLAEDPRNAQGWFLLARTAASMNRFDDAVEAFKKAQKEGMPEDESKDGETQVQKSLEKFSKLIDAALDRKEKEIMKV